MTKQPKRMRDQIDSILVFFQGRLPLEKWTRLTNGYFAAVQNNSRLKISLLVIANLYLLFKLGSLGLLIVNKIKAAQFSALLSSIMLWDIFVFLIFLGFVFFILLMTTGKPGNKKSRSLFFHGHPYILFLIVTPVAGWIFINGPIRIFDWLFLSSEQLSFMQEPDFVSPNPYYLFLAKIVALSIGISLADKVVKNRDLHLWTLPFFLLPLPLFNLFPVLWWNALCAWLPSRIWIFWRPVLTLATCMLPVLFFPAAQPIREGVPFFGKSEYINIVNMPDLCASYETKWDPETQTLYACCTDSILKIQKPADSPLWQVVKNKNTGFHWKSLSLDFPGHTAYIFDYRDYAIHLYDLNTMNPLGVQKIPIRIFPMPYDISITTLDKSRNQLILIDTFDMVAAVPLDPLNSNDYKYTYLPQGGPTAGVFLDEINDILMVLKFSALLFLDPTDLTVVRELPLNGNASGMAVNYTRGELYISYPRLLQVGVFDLKTLEPIGTIDAPIAVRTLAVDEQRGLLFVSAMTGVLEVRDLVDHRLIRRERFSSWIHWITVLEKQEQLILSSGKFKIIVFDYLKPTITQAPMDRLLQMTEEVLRKAAPFIPIGDQPFTLIRPNLENVEGTILVAIPDEQARKMAEGILKWGGYEVICVDTLEKAKRISLDQAVNIDAVLVDYALVKTTDIEKIKLDWNLVSERPVFVTAAKNEKIEGEKTGMVIFRPFGRLSLISSMLDSIRPRR